MFSSMSTARDPYLAAEALPAVSAAVFFNGSIPAPAPELCCLPDLVRAPAAELCCAPDLACCSGLPEGGLAVRRAKKAAKSSRARAKSVWVFTAVLTLQHPGFVSLHSSRGLKYVK